MTIFHQTASTLRPGAKTLPQHFYTSEHIFAAEIDRIFSTYWVCVGRAEQVLEPGDYIVRQVGQEQLIILRDKAGQIRAFYNLCRHRGTLLCTQPEGHFAGLIRCPYHAWGYAWDGELHSAPHMQSVAGFRREDYPLPAVAIAVWEGFLFVNLSDQPEPFNRVFASLIDCFAQWHLPSLRVAHRVVYDLKANWKLILQNYSECYHCPTLHPELTELSAASSAANNLYRGLFLGGPMTIEPPHTSLSTTGQRTLPVLGDVAGEDLQRAYYYSLFPNLLLSLQPDFVIVDRLEPISYNCTRVICEWLVAPETIAHPNFDLSPVVHFWDTVNWQDWQICESMQIGLQSRAYTPCFYSGKESLLAEIDREVLKALGIDSDELNSKS
jgi:Rieske 2Fe-2S family protein